MGSTRVKSARGADQVCSDQCRISAVGRSSKSAAHKVKYEKVERTSWHRKSIGQTMLRRSLVNDKEGAVACML